MHRYMNAHLPTQRSTHTRAKHAYTHAYHTQKTIHKKQKPEKHTNLTV